MYSITAVGKALLMRCQHADIGGAQNERHVVARAEQPHPALDLAPLRRRPDRLAFAAVATDGQQGPGGQRRGVAAAAEYANNRRLQIAAARRARLVAKNIA
jgi:hypothetical protein